MINAKTDHNQKEIVQGLRDIGASVILTHRGGSRMADVLVGWGGRTYIFEIKQIGQKEKPHQRRNRQEWRGDVWAVIHTLDEALETIGAI